MISFDDFLAGYIEAALFCGVLDCASNQPDLVYDLTAEDLATDTEDRFKVDCQAFIELNADDLNGSGLESGRLGNLFWYSRNGHGINWEDDIRDKGICERLNACCDEKFEQVDLYLNRDGLVGRL